MKKKNHSSCNKQLTATNHMTGMKIVQRYVDGVRYLKVLPSNLAAPIFQSLKNQFADKEVEITQSEAGWIKIEKTGENPELESAAKKAVGDADVDEDYVLNKEAEMLKQQGYAVKVEEIK